MTLTLRLTINKKKFGARVHFAVSAEAIHNNGTLQYVLI